MRKLLKNGELHADQWQILTTAPDTPTTEALELGAGQHLIPLSLFLAEVQKQSLDFNRCAPLLTAEDDVKVLKPYLSKLRIVALQFDQFMDGRAFSQARILREQLDYTGEIRAVGEFIIEQMFYLSRCGVDAFLLPEDSKVEDAQKILRDFSESYQAACDEPQPLFRRRV